MATTLGPQLLVGDARAVMELDDGDDLAPPPWRGPADDHHVTIRGNHFAGNNTNGLVGMGGAIGCQGDKEKPNLLVVDNTIGLTPLFPNGSPHGGGIGLAYCDATIDKNTIFAN